MSKRPASDYPGSESSLGNGIKVPRSADYEGKPTRQEGAGRHQGRKIGAADGMKIPVLFYKEGEPIRDLEKYSPQHGQGQGQLVEVRIPAASMSSTNRMVRARQLWGHDVYTQESDVVAVLMHMGYYSPAIAQPPSSMAEVRCIIRTLPSRKGYPSFSRNCMRSRGWASGIQGCSYKVEQCWVVTRSSSHVELHPAANGGATISPTFMPTHFERVLNTRSATAAGERRHRTMQEVTVQYNLVNEPWLKYSMNAIADHGLKASQWTSARLHKHVLFVETHSERYEISLLACPKDAEQTENKYRFSRCRKVLSIPRLREVGLPLPEELVQVIEHSITWEELQWSGQGVHVGGKLYPILRFHFFKIHS